MAGANVMSAELAGGDLTGATVKGANFNMADVDSAKLISLIGEAGANLDRALNLSSAFRD